MIPNRIRLVLLLVAGLLLGLALNSLTMTSERLLWMMAVLVSENGHWMAIACLVLSSLAVRRYGALTEWNGRFALAFLLASAAIFAWPSVSAMKNEAEWRGGFDRAFGTRSDSSWFQLSKTVAISMEEPKFERITFKARDGATVAYDFYRARGEGSHPLVVVVHGGGWDSGESGQLPALNLVLNRAGYAVSSVDYRLAPGAKWPTQRFDVEDAIADMKAHAKDLAIDPADGVYLLGRSAGGQIAGALAYAKPPVCIKGFVSFYAPTDLDFGYEVGDEDHWLKPRLLLRQLLGTEPLKNKEGYLSASLTEHVGPETPPTLLLHGRPDSLTWYKHSERLQTRLSAAGVRSYFIDFPWAHHGFDFFTNGPAGQISTSAILAFVESQKTRCR